MIDRINCRNCIHFNDLEHRCCLNDGKVIKKECYFTLSKRKPQGKDIVIENLKTKIADLEAEQVKEMQEHQETMLVADKKIKELEEQLRLSKMNESFEKEKKDNAFKFIEELKQQLTEKDEQIKTRVAVYEKQFIEQTDEIYKLQQKLAVKEAELGNVQRMYESATRDSAIYFKENIELREQLAEKENTITNLIEDSKTSKELLKKEIEELKAQRHIYLTRSVEECNKITDLELELQHKDEEIAYLTKQVKKFNNEAQKYFEDAYCNDNIYQDKISFCIEKLEKVGQEFSMRVGITDNNMDLLNEIIDTQIKQLKGGK